MAAERIKQEVLALPPAERAELAHLLLVSLEDDVDLDAEDAWEKELARRGQDIELGLGEGTPAEQVFKELRAKYR